MSTPSTSGPWIQRTRLHVLLPGTPDASELARAVLRGGADTIQLREKSADPARFLGTARQVQAICEEAGAALIVNDRVDAVLPSGALGVHLGQEDMPPPEARTLLGEEAIIGVSCHSLEEARRAVEDGADYIAVGCIFPSPTKPHLEPAGPDLVARVAATVRTPIVAIGGIRPVNAGQVIRAGAQAVAVSSAVLQADDPEAAARHLWEAISNP